MDREAWEATVRGVAKSWTRLRDCNALTETGTGGSRSKVQHSCSHSVGQTSEICLALEVCSSRPL